VSRGRRQEFAAFGWSGEVPDPQDPETYARSNLRWDLQALEPHRWLWEYYRALMAFRRQHPVLGPGGKGRLVAQVVDGRTLVVSRRGVGEGRAVRLRIPPGPWRRLVDSAEERFGGRGAKSPSLFPAPRGEWVEIAMASYGAAVYLREAAAARAQRQEALTAEATATATTDLLPAAAGYARGCALAAGMRARGR
jgi:maltooligosyltrehalose trehalohydrolase